MWAYRTCIVALLAAVMAFGTAAPSRAEQAVDLELVLAVDISWSMDLDEQQLQREGYVSALRDPEVWQAIRGGGTGRIALMYVEWAGQLIQQIVVPWTLIDSPAALEAFATRLEKSPISRERMTSLSGAIDFSASQFGTGGFKGKRRIIDVSGDGPNNSGGPVEAARDRAVSAGIVINGLPIMLKPAQRSGFFDINNLDKYYADCVIGGFGSFVIPVRARSEFAPAIRRKLILEIADLAPARHETPRFIRAQMSVPEERSDCMIGEKLWRLYIDGRFRE
ncbi:MAG: DUF1194 domain-containing protein [Hyphomicrobiaceae bacterium]